MQFSQLRVPSSGQEVSVQVARRRHRQAGLLVGVSTKSRGATGTVSEISLWMPKIFSRISLAVEGCWPKMLIRFLIDQLQIYAYAVADAL